jgi:protein-S-isoprenylcysteine O-methyltransferase Ste14
MPKSGSPKEGLVKEILSKGDLAAREIKGELWKRDVSFVRSYDRACSGLFLLTAILWLLPAIAKWSGWALLSFFAQLPRVVIVKEGPYRVIRHPGYLAEMVYFSVLPIILSKWVPFTILAAICIVIAIASCAYLIKAEDDFNLRKWGEEYRQYMKEVPAINFVKGLKAHKRWD